MIKKKEDKMKKEILPNVCESTQCKSCDKNCIWKPQPYTNADKIRALTDKELADFLIMVGDGSTPERMVISVRDTRFEQKMWLDWLKQEV